MTGLKKNCVSLPPKDRVALIDKPHPTLSIARQAELLGISRAAVYYVPTVSTEDIRIMQALDRLYTQYPFYGSRKMRGALCDDYGIRICREQVQRLMRQMGIEATYPKPHTSTPHPGHRLYPYLLRNVPIIRPNQVWSTDITYVPLQTGFCYLTAIIDWYSRYVLAWELSQTMEVEFCVRALKSALTRATPDIHNSDQGSQFTSKEYLDTLQTKNIQISMDGRGRCLDNIFVERLWRSVKYEDIYLKQYGTITAVYDGLNQYFPFYNTKRRHQGLKDKTPEQVYFA